MKNPALRTINLFGCDLRRLHMTPADYLMEYRLHCAQRLLHEGALPVTDIAQRTDFSDAAYFGKAFRAAFGMTPTQYRKRGDEAI